MMKRRNGMVKRSRFLLLPSDGRLYLYFLLVSLMAILLSVTVSISPFLILDDHDDRHTTNGTTPRWWRRPQQEDSGGRYFHSEFSRNLPLYQRQRERVVFYNVFVPPTTTTTTNNNNNNMTASVDHALKIVREQIMTLQSSSLLRNAPIHYTLIGKNETDRIQTICHELSANCIQSQYVPQGGEMLTLQAFWEYCNREKDALGTYIHNKGAFHPSVQNDNFRIMATKAVVSDACQTIPYQVAIGNKKTEDKDNNATSSHRSCNLCGARFTPYPHYHMTGNMFTSTCAYILNLRPPVGFEQDMEDLMQHVTMAKQPSPSSPSIPKPTFQQYRNGYSVGTQRFANEHWVGSHLGTLDPCDVVSMRHYRMGYKNLPSSSPNNGWTPSRQAAPRFDLKVFLKGTADRGAWYCGQARLYEYAYLYGQLHGVISLSPPPSVPRTSFLWDYYREAFKGCPQPLNYTQHSRLFLPSLSNATS